jgi:type IV pilus assembly protein PilA
MLAKLRRDGMREEGFTLIELLVVILIIGILAAIAIPAFLNQRGKAYDAAAKSNLVTARTAEETYATDNNGSYATDGGTGASTENLVKIEPALGNAPWVTATLPTAGGYQLDDASTGPSGTANHFEVVVTSAGVVSRYCGSAAPATGGNLSASTFTGGGCVSGKW